METYSPKGRPKPQVNSKRSMPVTLRGRFFHKAASGSRRGRSRGVSSMKSAVTVGGRRRIVKGNVAMPFLYHYTFRGEPDGAARPLPLAVSHRHLAQPHQGGGDQRAGG